MSQSISDLPRIIQESLYALAEGDWAAAPGHYVEDPVLVGFLDDALQIICQLDEPILILTAPIGIAKLAAVVRGSMDPWETHVLAHSTIGEKVAARLLVKSCLRESGQPVTVIINMMWRLTPDMTQISELVVSASMVGTTSMAN